MYQLVKLFPLLVLAKQNLGSFFLQIKVCNVELDRSHRHFGLPVKVILENSFSYIATFEIALPVPILSTVETLYNVSIHLALLVLSMVDISEVDKNRALSLQMALLTAPPAVSLMSKRTISRSVTSVSTLEAIIGFASLPFVLSQAIMASD